MRTTTGRTFGIFSAIYATARPFWTLDLEWHLSFISSTRLEPICDYKPKPEGCMSFMKWRDIGNIAKGPLNVLKRSWGYQDLDKSKMALVQRSSGQKKQKSTPNDPANPQQNNDDRQDDAVQATCRSQI
ncbi:hypothetical protein BC939DRAFT_56607 [Gamsiella multidivaricata]|uniref:uncharacterized protein n=1 Tax=Gamsiella multidivaricata TaxID=101098 RepID=UPI0022202BA5|nr:uncharacterized protein BC939DRAFT_56607 [Gamsiella multidivaricata]KAI7816176.1 hypothetical protein BC939DRAFT_56607 [Gamsiella multidivaricata]